MAATARKPATAAKPKTSLSARVDELGRLEAQMAELAEKAAPIKAALKELGVGTYKGLQFYCQVSDRNLPDRISRELLYEHFDKSMLVGLGIVATGGVTLAATVRALPDQSPEGERAAA